MEENYDFPVSPVSKVTDLSRPPVRPPTQMHFFAEQFTYLYRSLVVEDFVSSGISPGQTVFLLTYIMELTFFSYII